MELKLPNPDPRYAPPQFTRPNPSGWLHIGAMIAPPGRRPFVRRDPRRTRLLAALNGLAAELRGHPDVLRATVFRAVLIPPADRRVDRPARFDVAVLVETTSPQTLETVRRDPTFISTLDTLRAASSRLHVMAARCARMLAPVDAARPGLFLFNYFTSVARGPDTEMATALWEHLAAWYVAETGLTNSTLLAPVGPSDYILVNHARWDTGLPALAAAQFSKKTFRTYVRANLRANQMIAMPALYRLA